jgi:hypothetical protein
MAKLRKGTEWRTYLYDLPESDDETLVIKPTSCVDGLAFHAVGAFTIFGAIYRDREGLHGVYPDFPSVIDKRVFRTLRDLREALDRWFEPNTPKG